MTAGPSPHHAIMGPPQMESEIHEHEIHDVLRNERRVHTLKYLREFEGTVALRELSEEIACRETGESPPPRNIRESVYNSLHQTHLPKLDRLGVVDYDRNRKHIRLLEPAQEIDLYMELNAEDEVTWATYYRTVGIVALMTATLSDVGVGAFAVVPTAVWSAGFLGVLVVSLLYHRFER